MAFFDLPLSKLKTFKLPDNEPKDFDAFWKKTLAQARSYDLAAKYQPVREPAYKLVDVYDVTFNGYDGQPIKGWFLEPAGNREALPCLVHFIGYGGGRSLPVEHMSVPCAGFACFVMDTRGQGSSWSPGNTPDPVGSGPAFPGVMTRGIESPETYYYRRVFTDAARAVEAAGLHPHVDAKRIAVTGGSQGGGIAIAAAALSGAEVKLAMPDVPYLCGY
ncbi:MAG: alpha/beta fold hydrolase, partial [Planctomycetaceae bacterium]